MQLMHRNLPACLPRPWKTAPIMTGSGFLLNLRSLRDISKFERPIKENQHFISFLKCSHGWNETQQSSAQGRKALQSLWATARERSETPLPSLHPFPGLWNALFLKTALRKRHENLITPAQKSDSCSPHAPRWDLSSC